MKLRPIDFIMLVALICGLSYYATHWIQIGGWPKVAWKGSGVALLALWAFARGRPWIGLVLALGALGDMLLESIGLTAGAVAFLLGHVIAAGFYWRSHRTGPYPPALIAVAIASLAWQFPVDRSAAAGIGFYAVWLGLMAGTALVSRMPWTVKLGAVLFVVSDLLIFARMGPLSGSPLPGLLIWPTYFIGQALIAVGVVWSRGREDLHHRL